MSRETKAEQGRREMAGLQARLEEAEETLRALRSGELDAVIVGEQVYLLESAESASNRLRGDALALVHDAVIVVDNEERVTYLNLAAEQQYSITATEALGHKLSEVYQPRWLRPEDEATFAALAEQGYWRGENIHLKRNGETLYVESSVNLLRDHKGAPIGRLAIIRDITERHQAEQALRQSEERFALATQAVGAVIYDWQIIPDRIERSRELSNLLGFAPDDPGIATNAWYLTRLHPEDAVRTQQIIADAIASHAPRFEDEYRVRHKDGRYVWVRDSGVLLYDDQGTAVRSVGSIRNIDQRKTVEETLKYQTTLLEGLTESVLDGILIVSVDGRMLYSNQRFIDMWDFPPQVLESRSDAQALTWAANQTLDPVGFLACVQAVYKIPNNEVFEEVVMKDGRVFDRYGAPIQSEAIQYAWVWTFRDITERKQAEAKLKDSEKRLRLATAAAEMFSWEVDLTRRIYQWSENVAQVLGFSPPEDFAESMRLIHEEDRSKSVATFERACNENDEFEMEYRFVNPATGEEVWVCSTGLVITAADGPPSCVIGVSQNISKRKHAEVALRKSEAEFRQLANAVPQIVWVADADGKIEYINEQWIEFSGLTLAETSDPEKLTKVIHPDDHEMVLGQWTQAFESGSPYELEARMRNHKTGEYYWFLMRSKPTTDANGKVVKWFGTSTDITSTKETEEALRERNQRLDLLARISQELILRGKPETEMLQTVYTDLSTVIGAELFFHYNVSDQLDTLRLACSSGLTPALREQYGTIQFGEYLCGTVAARCERMIIENLSQCFDPEADMLRAAGVQCYAGFPLLADEKLIGTIAFATKRRPHFRVGELQLMQTVCDQVAATLARARTATALRTSEQKQRLAIEAAAMTTWELNLKTGVRTLGPNYAEVFGSAPQTVAEFMGAIHPDDREQVEASVQVATRGEQPYRLQYRTINNRGEIQWVESFGHLMYDEDTRPAVLLGVVMNITERKQAEERIEIANYRFRIAEEAAQGFNYEWNLASGAVTRSESMERILGYSREALAPTWQAWANLVHPDDVDIKTEADAIKMLANFPEETISSEYRVRHRDGHYVWVMERALLIRDKQGKVRRVIGQTMDVTARKEAEVEREHLLAQEQQARATAEAATRAKDEFLAVVSHELRNPLSAILGYARMARTQAHDAKAVIHHCEIVERSAKMQQQLIEDLLDTARIISGKLKIEVAPTDLRLVLDEALSVVLPAAQAKQINLVARLGNEPQLVIGDAARLQQIAWNLLQNAIKFTPTGGRVELRLERVDEQVHITVSDSGQGIEPEFLSAVFDRFSQRDMARTRRHGGLGLGLALVKDLVALHGGTVTVTSAGPGQGATFTIVLPTRAPQVTGELPPLRAIAEVRIGPEAMPLEDLPRLDNIRVLVVDDQEEAREIVAATLTEWGAVVTTAASGAEARVWLSEQSYDVLVCDISMPDEDGYAVIGQIRAREQEHGVPFARRLPAVALTALTRPEDRWQALSAGFQMHVAKPVELAELVVVISSLTQNGSKL